VTSPDTLPTPTTPEGEAALRAIVEHPEQSMLVFDFDGVLSPIVDDPERAFAHPGVLPALRRLAPSLQALAIVTGRPAEVVVRLGGFADVPELAGLLVVGHYGEERWDARTGEVTAPPVAPGVAEVRRALPALLREWGAPEGTRVEDKGRAVAVHVRQTADPAAATELLTDRLTELAHTHDLEAQPGRMVLELKPGGMDKGAALRTLAEEVGPRAVAYTGDDLGDLPAYDTVEELRSRGVAGLKVCSGSTEVTALADRADLVLDGPPAVAAFLEALAGHLHA
jgi:trehalose 6-phosphate phosphatase